jgi:hypothetical protein
MMRSLALSLLVLGAVATTSFAQPPATPLGQYDPNIEGSYGGIITSVISVTGPDGTVGVHLNLKTATGTIVKVHLGPAMFIGMNNFSFLADDLILVTGAYVSHDGELAVWARQVSKGGKTLALRSPDGTPRWPMATAEDPDGCGVSHLPVQY